MQGILPRERQVYPRKAEEEEGAGRKFLSMGLPAPWEHVIKQSDVSRPVKHWF